MATFDDAVAVLPPRQGGARGRIFLSASHLRGFGGRCREDHEPVPAVQFLVRSVGSEILWGTPCGVLFVVEFCRLWLLRGGLRQQGWPECLHLAEGYASVVLAVDSASLSFANIAYREVEVAGEFSFVAACRRGSGAPRRWERREWDEPVPPGYVSLHSETDPML